MKVPNGAKIFIFNKELNKYLFVLRDNNLNKPHPNMWSLLGGAIEEGETPIQAIKRELQEETDLLVNDIELLD